MSGITSRNRRPRRDLSRATVLNETLEPRRLFAAVNWDGGGDGSNWSDANNWSNNQVPTAGDDVSIDVAAAPTVVVVSSFTATARSLDCREAIDIRGTLNLAGASIVHAYARLQGTVTGAGNFQVHGYLEVLGNAARSTGSGRTTIGPAGRMLIGASPNTTLTLERNLYLEGGQVDWLAGEVRLNNATIDNRGVWRCSDPASPVNLTMRGVGGSNAFVNNIRMDVRAGTTTLTGVALSNANAVNVAGGSRLVLQSGGTHDGRFDLQAATASLALDGAHTFNPAAGVTGAGLLELVGGTTTRSGTMTLPRFRISGGTLDCSGGDVTFAGRFDWRGGTLRGGGGTHLIVPASSHLGIDGVAAARTLTGVLEVDCDSDWTEGEVGLTNGILVNNGYMNVAPTTSDVRLFAAGGTGQMFNHGHVYLGGSADRALNVDVPLTIGAAGILSAEYGTLALRGGGSMNGRVVTIANTTLVLNGNHAFPNAAALLDVGGHLRAEGGTSSYGGELTQQQSLTFAGGSFTVGGGVSGGVNITGGTARFNGSTTITNGTMSSGTLGGGGAVTVAGSFAWQGGTMNGTGRTTVSDEGSLQISGAGHDLRRPLTNDGFVNWSGGDITMGNGVIVRNNGLFSARSASSLRFLQPVGGSGFDNYGTLLKQLAGAVVFPPGNGEDGMSLSNLGEMTIEGGRVELRSPANHSGDFQIGAGAELLVAGSQYFQNGADLNGQGTLTLQGAQVIFTGNELFSNGRIVVDPTSTISFRGVRTLLASLEAQPGAYVELPTSGDAVLLTEDLRLHPGATMDVNDNALIVDYAITSPWGAVAQSIHDGYNGGAWNGAGLRSSTAAAAAGVGLACAEARDVFSSFPATFAGYPVNDTAILVRAHSYGDANLDGNVNLADFNRLAANFGSTSGSWTRGDFTYDGRVTLADFNALAANFGRTSAPSSTPDASDWDEDEFGSVGTAG